MSIPIVRQMIRLFALPTRGIFLAIPIIAMFTSSEAAITTARPALWTVHSQLATAYLLGSIHVLPRGLKWHTPEIDKAMQSADTFYFETSFDGESISEIMRYVLWHGSLPEHTTLASLLDKQALGDYRHALALAQVSAASVEDQRPWLASRTIATAYSRRMSYYMVPGPDYQLWDFAEENGKTMRCFETTQQQLDVLIPKDQKLEVAEFDAAMKDLAIQHERFQAILSAWSSGDVLTVGNLLNEALSEVPAARSVLLDDRNRIWMKRFDFMLSQKGTYFVVVGAGHMIGPNGVPALLRARGYKVKGPKT